MKNLLSNSYGDFIRKTTGYVLFSVLEKLVPFLLLPIIIRKVSVEGYGEYSFFLTLEAVLMPLLSLNLSNVIYRDYYKEKEKLPKYISTLFFGYFLLSCFFIFPYIIVVLCFRQLLSLSFLFCASLYLTTLLSMFIGIVPLTLRIQQKVKHYGFWQLFASSFMLIVLVISVQISDSYETLILFRLLALLITFLVVLVVLNKERLLKKEFDSPLFVYMLKFSLPTVAYSISSFAFSFSDRFFIKSLLGSEMLGIYSGIYQLCAVMYIAVSALNAAWMPWMFEKLAKEDYEIKKEVVKISYFVIFVLFFLGVVWGGIIPFIAHIMLTDVFSNYLNISWLFIFGFVFNGIYALVSPYIYYVGKTAYNAKIGIVSAIFSILLNYLLIPQYGILGSAIAFMFTWLVQALLFIVLSYKLYPMPWLLANKK